MTGHLLWLAEGLEPREKWSAAAVYLDRDEAHERGRDHTFHDPMRRYRVQEIPIIVPIDFDVGR
jgi:hypothetical protein